MAAEGAQKRAMAEVQSSIFTVTAAALPIIVVLTAMVWRRWTILMQ